MRATWICAGALTLLLLAPASAQQAGDTLENSLIRDPALLTPQPEPDCAFRPKDHPNAGELERLDYERQCYRQFEMIVRNRLQMLQDVIRQRAAASSNRIATDATGGEAAPKDIDRAQRLVELGDRRIAQGNIAIAREYYKRAADLGFAIAAMKMAETQDPNELARWNVRGIKPDPAEAKRWYRRAMELKASGAEARLRRLGD
jgi:TPR repeat protein